MTSYKSEKVLISVAYSSGIGHQHNTELKLGFNVVWGMEEPGHVDIPVLVSFNQATDEFTTRFHRYYPWDLMEFSHIFNFSVNFFFFQMLILK